MGNIENSPELKSIYIDPASMEWQESEFPGIHHKVLWSDPVSGRSTILFKLDKKKKAITFWRKAEKTGEYSKELIQKINENIFIE